MKPDTFTKVLLSIIAINLTFLSLMNLDLMPKSYASNPATEINMPPQQNYGLVPLNEDGTISVRLSSMDEIDVNIVGVSTYDELDVNISGIDTNDELDVNIDEIGGGYLSHGGPLPVEIE